MTQNVTPPRVAAPTLAASLAEFTQRLLNAALTDRDPATFVQSHSWWLLEDSGRLPAEHVVAVLGRRWAGS